MKFFLLLKYLFKILHYKKGGVLLWKKSKTINEFKTVLKTLRTKRGLSQEEIGKELGISKGAVCYYETGQRAPDIVVLSAFADYFGVSTDYLLGRESLKVKGEELSELIEKTEHLNSLLCESITLIDAIRGR